MDYNNYFDKGIDTNLPFSDVNEDINQTMTVNENADYDVNLNTDQDSNNSFGQNATNNNFQKQTHVQEQHYTQGQNQNIELSYTSSQQYDENEVLRKIEYLEKAIIEADKLRGEATTKKALYEEDLKRLNKEVSDMGFNYNDLDNEILKLENEITEGLNYIEDNTPIEYLKKWGKIK